MSATDPGGTAAGRVVGKFRLIERAGASVWKAEDTRNNKPVAIKVLSKGLPKDAAKREALVRDVRLNAALYHSFLVAIQEVAVEGETLMLVMEWLDAKPIASVVRGKPLDRTMFMRVAYQIADALKLMHAKNVIHNNIAGDSILLLPTGQAKLAGLNLGNILPRQGQPSQYQQKSNSVEAVAYMAPEQITNQPVTPQTDIFSLGVVLFEAATGRTPFVAATASELAHKIVEEQPPSPKALNPNVDNTVLGVMGGCLFKDSFKRYKDARLLLDSINRVDPEVAKFAIEIAKTAAAPSASAQQTAQTRNSIIFAADVANYDELRATNPAAAEKSAARMQQILGEAVYLFDGQVLDPFGPQMIAELPTLEAAVEAGRKGEFDFSQDQQTGEVIPVRMLLHAGEVFAREGSVGGSGVAKALDVLKTLPPFVLHVTEAFARRGKVPVRLRDAGARAGVKLATIVPPEPKSEMHTEIDTGADEAAAAVEAAAAAAAARAAKQKRSRMMAIAAVLALLVIGGAAFVFMGRKSQPVAAATTSAAAPVKKEPQKVMVAVAGMDPTLTERADAIRTAVVEILRTFPEVRVSDAAAADVLAFNAQLRPGATAPEIVVDGAPLPAPDNASAIQPLLQSVAARLRLPDRGAANPEAYNAFSDAVAAQSAKDIAKTDAALRIATKADPNFTPAQLLAMRFFSEQGKVAESLEAAKAVLTAQPDNGDAAKLVARMSLSSGDLASAFRGYSTIIRLNPKDTEALNTLAKYAVSVGDAAKLNAVLKRLASFPMESEVHEPDLLLAAGKIDAAVEKYYKIEEQVPNNAALSLKIGRIAVLRHSVPIAELELKKLQDLDPIYGTHMLKAYLAAAAGNKEDAANELKAALAGSTPGDDYWTLAAEVAAINGDANGVLDALERAAERKEPTANYILHDPLFSFLQNDARFQKVREALLAQQNEVRSSLATVSL